MKWALAFSLGLVALPFARPVFADDVKPASTSVVMVPQLVHGFDYHSGAVISIDGRFVASTHRGSIHVWDVESGALLPTLAAPGMPASTFLADGIRLRYVSASLVDGKPAISLVTWDVTTGKTTQRNGPRGLLFPAMVPGGKRALFADSETGAIRVYDIEADKELRTFGGKPAANVPPGKTNPNAVLSMVVPKDGAFVLLERGSGSCELWDVERGRIRYEVKRKSPTSRTGFSANGARAVYTKMADDNSNVTFDVLDVAAGKLLRSISLGRGSVDVIAVSPDGRRAVTSEALGKFHLWDLDTGKQISQHVWPISSPTTALTFMSDNHLLYGGSGRLEIWDITSWERIRSFTEDKSQVSMLSGAAIVGAAERAAVVGFDGTDTQVWNWDLSRLGMIGAKNIGPNTFLTFLAPNASRVWAPMGLGVSVWEIPSFAKRDMKQSRDSARDSFMALTADGSRSIVGQTISRIDAQTKKKVDEYTLSEWNAVTGAQTDKIRVDKGDKTPRVVATSADGRFAATADYDSKTRQVDMRIWDVGKGVLARSLDTGSINYPSAVFSPDGKAIAVVHMATATPGRQMVQVFDVATGAVRMSTKTNIFGFAMSITYSPNGQTIAVASGTIEVFQADSGTLLHTLRGDAQWVKALAFSTDGRHLLSAGQGGMAVLHRLDKPASVTMIGAGDDWLVYDADGYFDASRKGGRLVAAVDGYRAYRIDQLAVRNNRPDLLLERMGLGTPDVISHYRARYQRRLEKLGIRDESGLPTFGTTPDVLLTAVDVDGARAVVRFDATARGADLLRYNVFVNDVPLFGAVGKSTTGRVQHIEESIELGAGRNKIEVSALDARGGESLRAVRVVQHKANVKGDLYYLGFGVSKYKNSKYDLGYPHKDVTDLGDVLRAGAGKTFGQVHVQTFVNEAATVPNIRAAKDFLKNARVDDTVILFIAGHGLHATDAAADYYFATHEVEPHRLPETAARFDVVEELLMGIQSRKKLFLMDTCESGERETEDAPSAGIPTTSARTLIARSTRQLELDVMQATAVAGIPAPKRRIFDRERYIYNDLSRRTGAIVVSSSRGSEFSYELDEIANGVFTEELLLGLTTDHADENHDRQVSTDELRKYLMKAVPQRTDDQQHPTVDRDNLDVNFAFPVVPEAAAIVNRPDATPPSRSAEKPAVVSKPISTPASTPKPPGCACSIPDNTATTTGILGTLVLALAVWMRRRF